MKKIILSIVFVLFCFNANAVNVQLVEVGTPTTFLSVGDTTYWATNDGTILYTKLELTDGTYIFDGEYNITFVNYNGYNAEQSLNNYNENTLTYDDGTVYTPPTTINNPYEGFTQNDLPPATINNVNYNIVLITLKDGSNYNFYYSNGKFIFANNDSGIKLGEQEAIDLYNNLFPNNKLPDIIVPVLVTKDINHHSKSTADKLVDGVTDTLKKIKKFSEKHGDVYIQVPINKNVTIQYKNEHGNEYSGIKVTFAIDFNCILFKKCPKNKKVLTIEEINKMVKILNQTKHMRK